MTLVYAYGDGVFNTEDELNAAVTSQKNILDNRPSVWVDVKMLSGNETDGWTVPGNKMTDEEINNLDTSRYYNVTSITHGVTYTGITGTEANTRIWGELRRWFAQFYKANEVNKIEIYAPTNQDMSGYV